MSIRRATEADEIQCTSIIFDSELGKRYYPSRKLLLCNVREGIRTDNFFVKTDDLNVCGGGSTESNILGLIWYQTDGAFHSYPYLHIVAVREDQKRNRIGTELLDFFENDVLENGKNHIRTKVFLTVADFNSGAEQFYRSRGYEFVCELPDLFRNGVTERLMMKAVLAN